MQFCGGWNKFRWRAHCHEVSIPLGVADADSPVTRLALFCNFSDWQSYFLEFSSGFGLKDLLRQLLLHNQFCQHTDLCNGCAATRVNRLLLKAVKLPETNIYFQAICHSSPQAQTALWLLLKSCNMSTGSMECEMDITWFWHAE